MKDEVAWITDALSSKNIAREMTHYRIQDNEIRATDGRLTAGHPFPHDGAFLVPGSEFEKIIKRLPGSPTIEVGEDKVILKSGRSRGEIRTLPIEQWDYPGIDEDGWQDAPEGLIPVLRKLRPFVSDNATQIWTLGVALEYGYAYATNNIVVAGARCDALGDIKVIMPVWAVEFLIDREEGLTDWQWTANYVAFRWSNGAWMRAQLLNAEFLEQASRLVRSAEQATPSQAITKEFKASFARAVDLCEGGISVSATEIGGSFGQAHFADGVDVKLDKTTWWAAKYLKSVIAEADWWEPSEWPGKATFKGEHLFGVILGRREQ